MLFIHGNQKAGKHDDNHCHCRKARPCAVFEQKEKVGSPIRSATEKQKDLSALFRLKATFVFVLWISLWVTGTYAKKKPTFLPLVGVEYRFCQCAGFEQGETEDNGIGCKGKNRAVQVVR